MILNLLVWIEFIVGKCLSFLSPNRLAFEKRNDWEPGAMSFHEDNAKADLCVEFSSEGEFEQIRYLLEQILKDKKRKIELIFCSESVEQSVLAFQLIYRDQVRYQRLCLYHRTSRFQLQKWVTASNLILVRYDFFPQLIKLGTEMRFFALFSASVKSLQHKNFIIKKVYQKVFSLFDLIVPVNQKELDWIQSEFSHNSQELIQADLRVNQIQERSGNSDQTLKSKFNWWQGLSAFLNDTKKLKVIIGNFWTDEMDFYGLEELTEKIHQGQILLSIAPHNLSEETNQSVIDYFKKHNLLVVRITEGYRFEDLPENAVLLFDLKGVLCELYNFFNIAMVGGGYLRTTHSLLEPYVAGAKVITGPEVHKSSEYDYIMAQNQAAIRIHRPNSALNSSGWEEWILEKNFGDSKNDDKLTSLMERVLSDS